LFEAEERINKLMGEVNEGNSLAKKLQEEIQALKMQLETQKRNYDNQVADLKQQIQKLETRLRETE
jgi:predicted  nucleic acid-binding Zn-ribbon protein